ncbi:ATP-grasp domain-containing protein [Psychromicrobium lacuslunae]|uniref:ATP-grasp domain-containing protein n=1 Tax=Psychromicrobium lacuslunae TaxID=1618207 RepID=UPI0005D37D91|nr:ATP-grasp domain-containing protein [Psychromicrobium lacuslunae]
MSATKLLMVGGAGPSDLSIDACRRAMTAAKNLGFEITVTFSDIESPEAQAVCDLADHVVAVSLADTAERRRYINDLEEPYQVVFGVRDAMQLAVAEIAEALQARGNPVESVHRAIHKDLCRAALSSAGLTQPRFQLCSSLEEAELFVTRESGPVIIKPRAGTASIGVSLVNGPEELPAAIELLPEPDSHFIAESYVNGEEFSIEGYFLQGEPVYLACTAKRTLSSSCFVEVGHVVPAPYGPAERSKIEDSTTRALEALDLSFGVFHIEGWIEEGEVTLGEIHTRVGGDWIHLMAEYASGVDYFSEVFADAVGSAVPKEKLSPPRQTAAIYLTPPPGEIVAIEGWPVVLDEPGVLHAELSVTSGGSIRRYQSSRDRIGVIVGTAAGEASEVEEYVRMLSRTVQFTMADGSVFDGLGTLLERNERWRS